MKIKDFFRPAGVKITGNDIKALLIKNAIDSEDSYRDLRNTAEYVTNPFVVMFFPYD